MFAKSTFKLLWVLIFLLLFSIRLGQIKAEESPFSRQKQKHYSIEERNDLFLQALTVLPDNKIPIEYRSAIPAPSPIKCATMILGEVRQNFDIFSFEQKQILNKLLQRPVLPLSMISPSGRFKIHYTDIGSDAVPIEDLNNNGIPDFVEEVTQAFENSYQVEVNQLSYQEPPDDAGVDGAEYDVYIENLGSNFYGFTQPESDPPETHQNDRRSYIVIDNDFSLHFTRGVPAAKVTAAHEYLHAIQFGYRNFSLVNDERYYYEFCSVWMEDVVYDDVNDYYQYLPTFFRRTNIPFNTFDHFGHYLGQALWNHFLVKKYDDFSVIRRTWEIMQDDKPVLDAIDLSLKEKGSSFINDFSEFAVWNYFTGIRADPINFYDESTAYPEILLQGEFMITSDTTLVDSSLSLTHKYYKFTTQTSGVFEISGNLEDPEDWRFAAIISRPGSGNTFRLFNLLDGQNLGFSPNFTEIVVIPINLQILEEEDLTLLNSTYRSFTFDIKKVPFQGITQIFPNPFIIERHERINIEFVPADTEVLEVRILTAGGRVVKTATLNNGLSSLTPSSFIWDGTDDNNELVASGIYLVQLKKDNFLDIRKFAVIRE